MRSVCQPDTYDHIIVRGTTSSMVIDKMTVEPVSAVVNARVMTVLSQ